MTEKVKVESLFFEITRRCNQSCDHCCKGKSQNVDMNSKVIDNLFRSEDYKITEIGHFSITGGEPTLVPNVVEYLINTIIELNIDITSHVIFLTNGLIYDEMIIGALDKLMKYLANKENCQDVQLVFELSNDQFHVRPSKEVLEKYATLPFLNKKFLTPRVIDDIMNEGNAKDNGIGGNRTYKDYLRNIECKSSNDEIEISGDILVAANGNIINVGCTSYIEEDKIALGNLSESSFLTIIRDSIK